MRVFGIDFTSAPSRRKTIACAACRFSDDHLLVEAVHRWQSLDQFASFLDSGEDDWLVGIDAPLGQPRRLVEALRWPDEWSEYVSQIGSMRKVEFVEQVTSYSRAQPIGDKHHFRATDILAGSCSPMMMYGVPVGRMFYEAAPRVLRANVSILPCRPKASGSIIVESYPALMARRVIDRLPYKSGDRNKGEKLFDRRQKIVSHYSHDNSTGVTLHLPQNLRATLSDEPSADGLDAVLSALQIASASCRTPYKFGVPANADPLEGWIVDPDLTSFPVD